MSDVIKWALLAAAVATLILMIFALPIAAGIDVTSVSDGIAVIVDECADFLVSARGLINSFLTDTGRVILTALLTWIFAKFLLVNAVKIVSWVYHFIFK